MPEQQKLSVQQLLDKLQSNLDSGLTTKQVERQFQEYGKNELVEQTKPNFIKRVWKHMSDVTSLVLLFAVFLSVYLTFTGDGNWTKTIVIAAILVINVAISLFQEGKAEQAIASLQSMTTPTTKALRAGTTQTIDTVELVPGDVIFIAAGDSVPADGIVLETTDLLVEEAILTGESEPVEKQQAVDAVDETSQVYSGTAVVQGRAKVLVTKTGMTTEMGKIAGMLNATQAEKTPLAKRLNALGIRLSVIAILGGLVAILASTLMYNDALADSVMIGVSLAIAAVPESLPVIVTLSLAHGVRLMAKRNAIVRRITAVETIGNVTIIASDKTGTLTQNKMTVTQFWSKNTEVKALGHKQEQLNDLPEKFDLWALATTAKLASDEQEKDTGSPTELAILRFVLAQEVDPQQVLKKYPQVAEDPFNSEKKMMATLHKYDGKYLAVVKGAFDRLQFGDQVDRTQMQQHHDEFATKGLRILAAGFQWFTSDPGENWPEKLTELECLGLVGIQDPPRAEVPAAISEAQQAGIKTVMITGDHLETARTIATEIGILQADELVLTGQELNQMSDDELLKKITDVRVFARTTPSDKLRIVKLWQQLGEVVAMTGDGVNDAPALKAADVGIAMGITGTDVSKNASDMILVDDNFATIIEAVRQGRTVYQNILKAVEFLVSVNFAQIFTLLFAILIGWGAPLTAEQMLIINVLADGIPGFFLSQEAAEPGIMKIAPIKRASSIWHLGLGKRVAVRTATYVTLILGVYAIGRFGIGANNAAVGMSMLFFVLAIGSILDIFPIKTRQPLSIQTAFNNRVLTRSIVGTITALLIIGVVPNLARIFGVVMLPLTAWLIVLIGAILPMLVVEGYKRVQHRNELRAWAKET
ncbi:cation-translocating P-type ATPase [Pediococcus siamensis]|uniref:cation-translocating P-type ATPase n=1 Tax=Pediococcus siamensis TaxID=381829 RepID=UPI0039A1FEA0